LRKYYEVPEFISNSVNHNNIFLNFFGESSNYRLKGFAYSVTEETYVCLTTGNEIFRLVSPVFKQNMYSGVREELSSNISPVDLFYEQTLKNFELFPLLQLTQVFEVNMTAGNCMFVPSFWWIQSYTPEGKESIMTVMEFEKHSLQYELVNKGIDSEIILNDINSYHASRER